MQAAVIEDDTRSANITGSAIAVHCRSYRGSTEIGRISDNDCIGADYSPRTGIALISASLGQYL